MRQSTSCARCARAAARAVAASAAPCCHRRQQLPSHWLQLPVQRLQSAACAAPGLGQVAAACPGENRLALPWGTLHCFKAPANMTWDASSSSQSNKMRSAMWLSKQRVRVWGGRGWQHAGPFLPFASAAPPHPPIGVIQHHPTLRCPRRGLRPPAQHACYAGWPGTSPVMPVGRPLMKGRRGCGHASSPFTSQLDRCGHQPKLLNWSSLRYLTQDTFPTASLHSTADARRHASSIHFILHPQAAYACWMQ